MENFIHNPFENGFVQIVTLETLLLTVGLETIYSLVYFLPNYTGIDSHHYPETLEQMMQNCRLISNKNFKIKPKQILNESGIILTPEIIINDVNFIRQGIQVIAEFVAFCKRQIFWISINQNERLVFID